jgi:hypothetical protein
MRINVILFNIIFIAVNIRIESEHDNLAKSFANPNKKHKLQDNIILNLLKRGEKGVLLERWRRRGRLGVYVLWD